MDVDTRELTALATDLGKVKGRAVKQIAAVVKKTMQDTKSTLQGEAEGVKHAPRFPRAISYDVSLTGLAAEIGPEEGGAGSLALLYLGNSRTGPRLKDPIFAMKRNAELAEPHFAKAAGDVL